MKIRIWTKSQFEIKNRGEIYAINWPQLFTKWDDEQIILGTVGSISN